MKYYSDHINTKQMMSLPKKSHLLRMYFQMYVSIKYVIGALNQKCMINYSLQLECIMLLNVIRKFTINMI